MNDPAHPPPLLSFFLQRLGVVCTVLADTSAQTHLILPHESVCKRESIQDLAAMTQFSQWRDCRAGTSTLISLPLSAHHVLPLPSRPITSLTSSSSHPPSASSHFLRLFHFLGIIFFFLRLCLHADNLNHAHSPRQAAVADGGSHCGVALDAEGVSDLLRERAGLGSFRLG